MKEDRVDGVVYAWFDEGEIPRAYAYGPRSEAKKIRALAREMLLQYVEKKNALGWNLAVADFKEKYADFSQGDAWVEAA